MSIYSLMVAIGAFFHHWSDRHLEEDGKIKHSKNIKLSIIIENKN